MFEEVEERRRRLDGYRPFGPDVRVRLDAVFEPWFVYASNALAGNTLGLGDTILLIRERRLPAGKSEEEYLEVKGQQAGYGYLHHAVEDRVQLSEPLVRELHKLLTVRLEQTRYRPGQYKPANGVTGAGVAMSDSPSATQVVKRLVDWFHGEAHTLHPIERAAWLHQKLMLIRPFRDGNGRTARLLANLALLQGGYMPALFRSDGGGRRYREAMRSVEASVAYHVDELRWSHQLALDVLDGRLPVNSDELVRRFARAADLALVSAPVPTPVPGPAPASLPLSLSLPAAPPARRPGPDDTILEPTISLDALPGELASDAVKKLNRRVSAQVTGICSVLNRGWTELRAECGQELGGWRDLLDENRLRDLQLEPRALRADAGVVWVVLKRRPSSATSLLVPANRFELCTYTEPLTLCLAGVRHLMTSEASVTHTASLRLDLDGSAWRAVEVERFVIEQLNLFLGATEAEIENLNPEPRGRR
jgi:prophage maintenance system killer protein